MIMSTERALMESETRDARQNLQTLPNQASGARKGEMSIGKTAYSEIALRAATSRIDGLEKELQEMQSMLADHERRRHEAETKACAALRKAQDSDTRFNISDKRRKDAEEKARELEAQITDAVSFACQSELLSTEGVAHANRFDKIRGVLDSQAFEESKKRVDAEHRAHELMKKRAEAETKCLEETERRVQAEVRAKQEMRVRIDEEMRNKALRSKLRDAEEKIKAYEFQRSFLLDCERRKKAEAEDALKTMLSQARQSLSHAEQKWEEAEAERIELEQEKASAEARAVDCEMKLQDGCSRVAELELLLDQARTNFEEKLESTSRKLGESNKKVAELQVLLDHMAVSPEAKTPKITISLGRPSNNATDPEQEENYVKVAELQTVNADLEATIRELTENLQQREDNHMKLMDLHVVNLRLEATVQELEQRLEQEGHAKLQLQATIEELEDTIRELTEKSGQVKTFEGSAQCRRLGDSLLALRVEENPLFRPEPVPDNLQRNFLSRPNSLTDDSQTSPRQDAVTCNSQGISLKSPAMLSSDSETNLLESPKSIPGDEDESVYHREKQSLLQKLAENEALIVDLKARLQDGQTEQLQLKMELEEALQSRDVADMKADAMMRQLELTLQREERERTRDRDRDRDRDTEFPDLSGSTSIRGKKEKWGILDRFRSKIKSDNPQTT